VLVLFLVYFFLVTGDLYKRKVVKIAGPTLSQKKITVQILDEINLQIASFMRRTLCQRQHACKGEIDGSTSGITSSIRDATVLSGYLKSVISHASVEIQRSD